MTSSNTPCDAANLSVIGTDSEETFEQIIARYESAWHTASSAPRWEDYLPSSDMKLRSWLTAELPRIEAEFLQSSPAAGPQGINTSAVDTSTNATSKFAARTRSAHDGHATSTQPRSATTRFGKVLRHESGGLGDIWVIQEPSLDRVVVVKQLQARWKGNLRAERAFWQEVRITGLLEHPNIVPVHCVGSTCDGRPFYSMRFIEGDTLQQALDRHHQSSLSAERATSLRQLIRHFVQVCRTVAFANSRGIIHRDLKPSNVVIGKYGETIVLDWGLAKQVNHPEHRSPVHDGLESPFLPDCCVHAFNQRETAPSGGSTHNDFCALETEHGDVVGTPAYMSPEQASGNNQLVSVRTDVFGLGAILYAILFGRPPLVSSNSEEAIRLAEASQISFTNCSEQAVIASGLIAICRKATARSIEQRYENASALADDVEAWMAGEDIALLRQPVGQRLVRFALHRGTLLTAICTCATATLIVAVVGALSVQHEAAQKELAAAHASASARATEKIAEYISQVYRAADPMRLDEPRLAMMSDSSAKSTLKGILDNGLEHIDEHLADYPEQLSDLLLSLGKTYCGLGEFDRAESLLGRAKELRGELVGPDHLKYQECSLELARLSYDRGEYTKAEESYRRLLMWQPSSVSNSPGRMPVDADAAAVRLFHADVQFQLAWLLFYQPLSLNTPQFNRLSVMESKQLLQQVIATRQELLPAENRSIGLAYAGLAAACLCTRDHDSEALAAAATAMEIFSRCKPQSSFGSFVLEYGKAERLRNQGKDKEAEAIYLRLREFIEQQVGKQHPLYLVHLWNMAGHYRKFGHSVQADATIAAIRGAVSNQSFRASALHLDGLRQYAEALLANHRREEAKQVYLEIEQYANDSPDEHAALIDKVQRALSEFDKSSLSTPTP